MGWAWFFRVWAVALLANNITCQQMPPCAAACMDAGVGGSSCSSFDTQCICANTALEQNISGCIVMTCSVKEALTSQNASNTMCGIEPRDISHITTTVTSVFMALAIAFTLMRCSNSRDHYEPEDIFAVLALDGYGKDIWTLPFDSITRILRFTWLLQLLYIPALAATKMAFLCLYLRIFPSTGIRRVTWVLVAINVLYLLTYGFGTAFNFLLVSYIWTKWHGETEGSCLNFNAFGIANATTNIALDLAVIGLPLHKIAGLSVSLSKKIMLLAMFGLGFFVTTVSILRLTVVITYATTTNATCISLYPHQPNSLHLTFHPADDTVATSYWSIIECFSGIVCINLPSARQFYRKVTHFCFGTFQTGQEEGYQNVTLGCSSASKKRKLPIELSILKTTETTVKYF
ncbi:hypothetical protein F9C07_2059499 [Aspergillus flavus]|uniref:CFEM domain-containing protein n=1 Tax=Aspergillus flavus (strain ATCC 200026 / FGSC A1120 / IAM 13836 / NRRL 3357 / JCM 12722 / SRRC 167) TaxID=332952 RepID=A0A7U2MNL3_ASPFN|nr:hypothetical protein F9C07_2059499 [Aspergillus flavus]